jgi:hypothetical protein
MQCGPQRKLFVMAGLVPAIHVFKIAKATLTTWMPGLKPGMTPRKFESFSINR